jgi:hypothetical protein
MSTILRIAIISLMFFTSLFIAIDDEKLGTVTDEDFWPEFDLQRAGVCLSIVGFAGSYSLIIPSVTSMMTDKTQAVRIQVFSNITISGMVLALGIVASYVLIGTNAPSQTSLAWAGYDAGFDPRPWWTYIIEYMVILFPAINVLSSAPLIALAVAGNVMSVFKTPSLTCTRIVRAGMWVIPAVLAVLTHELGLLAAISGIPCYFLFYAVDSMCWLSSYHKINVDSKYASWASKPAIAWINIILCLGFTIFTLIYIAQ